MKRQAYVLVWRGGPGAPAGKPPASQAPGEPQKLLGISLEGAVG
jgi:hypothetical protein